MNVANVNPDGIIEWLGDDGVVNSDVKETMAEFVEMLEYRTDWKFWPQKVCTQETGGSGTSTSSE